jgi:3-oxoacyl-[acyl-carrier protein] reductase
MKSLQDRVALVTGASRGLGAAIVKRLAADGANVALTYSSSPDRAQAVVREVETGGGRALAIAADAADPAAVRTAVTRTAETYGRLDILVNNAGTLVLKPLGEVTVDDFDHMVAVNVRAFFIAAQEAAQHMKSGGRIINIGSINSEYVPFTGGSLYALTKSAIVGLTKALARDLGPRGITINNVQPGPTDTDMNPATGAFADQARSYVALARYASPAEIADFVAYLASSGSSFITGASLRIDGGYAA